MPAVYFKLATLVVFTLSRPFFPLRFLTGMPSRFEPAQGDVRLCAALITCDPHTGRATSIERIMIGQGVRSETKAAL